MLSEDEQNQLKSAFEKVVEADRFEVKTNVLNPDDQFVTITRSEFERRMSEMQGMGGMAMFGNMPEKYVISVNSNHPLARKVADGSGQEQIVSDAIDLAKLSQNLLKGEELSEFIKRQMDKL